MHSELLRAVDSTVAVIVLYRPDHRELLCVESVLKRFMHVIIVDNTPEKSCGEKFKSRCKYIKNTTNIGLSAAYNLAVQQVSTDIDTVITFDQDTLIDDSIQILIDRSKDRRCDIFCSNWDSVDMGAEVVECDWCISSTMCFSVEVFRKVGGFSADFFIDYVDLDFCLKSRLIGSRVFKCRDVVVDHPIGIPSTQNYLFGLIQLGSSNHSQSRRYFMGRNLRKVAFKYWRCHHRVVFRCFLSKAKMIVLILLVESNSRLKIYSFLRGFIGVQDFVEREHK